MKKGKNKKINIHFSNRWLYTFIALGIILAIAIGVYAVTPNPGHASTEIDFSGNGVLPHLVLDSLSTGDAWTSQGAYISLGESGALGSAALHMTYRGDGYGFVGAGAVTNAIPAFAYLRFDYDSKNIYSDSAITAASFVGDGSGLTNLPIGAVTNNKWCAGDGDSVECNKAAPVLAETDPSVKAWAKTDTGAIRATTLTATGAVTAGSFVYSSDKALKTNIQPLQNSLSKIKQLNGVSFNWKSNGEKSIGLIAQDVEKVYPELVSGTEGNKGVEYGNLVAVLIEAVKEQQKQIDELKSQIQELKEN
ncbi:MAG: tail fiber domain-containing protein [Candidatus Nanoarchaeia archaeon]|nr:tail fiber domain-containing protein [Candidatus Nanoarchaeia archaeon]